MGFDYKNVDAEQLKTVSASTILPFRRWTAMPFQPLVVPSTPAPRIFTSHLPTQASIATSISKSKNQAEAFQVQTTLTIKEQQEALIKQRRKDAENGGESSEPKQIEFRNWQPPAPGEMTKSLRRPPGPPSAAHLSVNTGRSDEVMSGIRVSQEL
jgi:hypothetical protein